MMRTRTGAAPKLLPIAMAFGLLAACGQQPATPKPELVKSAKSEIDEVDALVAATKQHPSLVNGAKDAGPPIHVDPVPRSNGMTNHKHMAK